MDPMFMFNSPIIAPFAPFRDILPRDLIPITIFGFMKIVPAIAVNGVSFKLILVSRRSIYRNGRRYNTRGIDANAHVANFVETEQIAVQDCGIVTSYVQVEVAAWFSLDPRKHSSGLVAETHHEIHAKDLGGPCNRKERLISRIARCLRPTSINSSRSMAT